MHRLLYLLGQNSAPWAHWVISPTVLPGGGCVGEALPGRGHVPVALWGEGHMPQILCWAFSSPLEINIKAFCTPKPHVHELCAWGGSGSPDDLWIVFGVLLPLSWRRVLISWRRALWSSSLESKKSNSLSSFHPTLSVSCSSSWQCFCGYSPISILALCWDGWLNSCLTPHWFSYQIVLPPQLDYALLSVLPYFL